MNQDRGAHVNRPPTPSAYPHLLKERRGSIPAATDTNDQCSGPTTSSISQTRNEVQQKWMNGEIPVVVATITFGMGIDKANAKKGLSDDAKDVQIKALQTGFEKMLEYCEKVWMRF
ncbi:hypothetical protein WR25_03361 [Diploscapter pachys]|uniref:Uncharacterized protein n=1 Tax=Diploscapter pachys TaxID=2018661 RepID=A0A2A2LL58_9BILA|nr:hypothetical protein WR25_03361 [Diploscapter pachys]